MNEADAVSEAGVLGPGDGTVLGSPDLATDRFMIGGSAAGGRTAGGRFALVEHVVAPGALAAPLHLHTREDEFSYVLDGRMGALLGEREIVAGPGDLVVKPRDQWHTFWNAGDVPLRVLELISPAGLEELFVSLGRLEELDEATLAEFAAGYGCRVDMAGTAPIVQRHGLRF
jgi:mannose-6-phosphate isomerase-like protein (cupin superfamily)